MALNKRALIEKVEKKVALHTKYAEALKRRHDHGGLITKADQEETIAKVYQDFLTELNK